MTEKPLPAVHAQRESASHEPVLRRVAEMAEELPPELRTALASLSQSRGYASIRNVMTWCSCDEQAAISLLRALYDRGYLQEDSSQRLYQPQMIQAMLNCLELPLARKHRARAGNISRQRRARILHRDNHTCRYCHAYGDTVRMTLDHVEAKARGGLSTDANLVACCTTCNEQKRDLSASEFITQHVPRAATPPSAET